MNFANQILCADHNQLDYLVKSNIKKEKVSVILNTPDPHFFKNKENAVIRNNIDVNMVYHGTISHRLGIDNILRAINISKSELQNFKFHLIGTGDLIEEVKKIYDKLNLKEQVLIYNRNIPVEELDNYLSKMDIGIIANRITNISKYMLPVKLLEYVFCGIPVIAPRNEIIPRYFTEDMLCFYEPENIEEMAEKILFLYENKEAREKFSFNALKFTEQYNYETEMKKYEAVLKELV
jgi:glycosyltransferase involved in cell wall biosynthesis